MGSDVIGRKSIYKRLSSYYDFSPGLAIVITIFALNVLGDGLRDALDPKLKTIGEVIECQICWKLKI